MKQIHTYYTKGSTSSPLLLALNPSRSDFNTDRLAGNRHFDSPFRSVSIDRFKDSYPAFVGSDLSVDAFCDVAVATMESILMDSINDKEQYLFLHSAGRDCTLISSVMVRLRDAGKKDFSNVHFRCHGIERPLFLQLMQRQGWTNYSLFEHRGTNPYNLGSDVSVNGWGGLPLQMNFWRDIPNAEKMIVITGLGGGEMFLKLRSANVAQGVMLYEANDWLLNRTNEAYLTIQFKDALYPYFDFRWHDAMMLYNKGMQHLTDNEIRNAIIAKSCPTAIGLLGINTGYNWELSDIDKQNIINKFYSLQFYKDYRPYFANFNPFEDLIKGMHSHAWGFGTTIYEKIC